MAYGALISACGCMSNDMLPLLCGGYTAYLNQAIIWSIVGLCPYILRPNTNITQARGKRDIPSGW